MLEMEKFQKNIAKAMKGREFKNQKEVQAFMDGFIAAGGGKLDNIRPESAEDEAMELIYEAQNCPNPKDKLKLAKQALKIDPDCTDAWIMLAASKEEPVEQLKDIEKGLEAGKRRLGEDIFKQDKGRFWGLVETRPYMRAMTAKMECLHKMGKKDEALAMARLLLELNTNDNQGNRYLLLSYLCKDWNEPEIAKLLDGPPYKEDYSTEWFYTRVLLYFAQGKPDKAGLTLAKAYKINPHVPDFLLGRKRIATQENLPGVASGGEYEAFLYNDCFGKAWNKIAGALDWLRANEPKKAAQSKAASPNEPCPLRQRKEIQEVLRLTGCSLITKDWCES